MGKIWQGILGGVSGRVGNVIGSSWKGIPVIKSRPLSVANPRTSGQLLVRGKLTKVVAIASPLTSSIIIPLWNRFASRMSGYNAFVQANMDSFDDSQAFIPANFVLGRGRMAATQITNGDIQSGNTSLLLTWPTTLTDSFQTNDDEPFAVVISATGVLKSLESGSNTRDSGSLTMLALQGMTFAITDYVFLAFRRPDGTVVSNTSFKLVIA